MINVRLIFSTLSVDLVMAELKRKGSRSAKDISTEVLDMLNSGKIETANLVEWLAVDQKQLLENLLLQIGRTAYLKPILICIESLPKQTVNTINEAIGTGLFEKSLINNDTELFAIISTHRSDLVRCWASYGVAKNPSLNIIQKLDQIKPFAADRHFGVREICWLAVRSSISQNLKESIEILKEWTKSDDENVRRFASEATRPRGVWCPHIEELKQNPELGLEILEGIRSDQAKYVRDSVGNWLNDASKTKPQFVSEVCKRWKKESPTKETEYIIKRALRTIDKIST